jgi:hypothetical protein
MEQRLQMRGNSDIVLDAVHPGGFDILMSVRGGDSQRFRRLHSEYSE